MEVISDMAPDEVMKTCPVDNCEEHNNSICQNVLSGSMEPCPGNIHDVITHLYSISSTPEKNY